MVLRDVEIAPGAAGADPFGEALRSGAVDVVTGPPIAGADAFRICEVRVICAVPSRHPWRKEPRVEVEQLRDRPLLTSPAHFFSRGALEQACRGRGFKPLIEIESVNPSVLVELGRHGIGLPVIASDAVPRPNRPWPVVVDRDRPLRTKVWLSSRSPRDPSLNAFVDIAQDMAVTM